MESIMELASVFCLRTSFTANFAREHHFPGRFFRRITLIAAIGVSTNTALGQGAGSPDPTWTVQVLPEHSLSSIALQPDGKVLAAGRQPVAPNDAIFRFDTTGHLDNSFGSAGRVGIQIDNFRFSAQLAVDAGGRFYASGIFIDPNANIAVSTTHFALLRYLANGTLDTSFGTAGVARLAIDATKIANEIQTPLLPRKLVLQPDGKLLLMGYGHEPAAAASITSIVLARFNSDGSPDADFGADGLTLLRLPGNGLANDVVVTDDGSLFIAGSDQEVSQGFALKLTPHGEPDAMFGVQGKAALQVLEGNIQATAIAVQEDGKVVVGARRFLGPIDRSGDGLLLLRLNDNGLVDTSFASGGFTFLDLTANSETVTALSIEPSGKILAAANVGTRTIFAGNPALLRFTSQGQLDSKFGTGGIANLSGFSADDLALGDAAFVLTLNSGFPLRDDPHGLRKIITTTTTDKPLVAIANSNTSLIDTDNVPGEIVTVSASAADTDGSIVKTTWLVNGGVAATGTNASLTLPDGTNVVSFSAMDNDGAVSRTEVVYDVAAPATELPRLISRSTTMETSDTGFSVAVRDANNALITTTQVGQQVSVTGYIFPQDVDVNYRGDIFVVAATPTGWFMRDTGGQFIPWNSRIPTLVPAFQNAQLTEVVRVPVQTGSLSIPGSYHFYVGYRRTDSNELIYTAAGGPLVVSP